MSYCKCNKWELKESSYYMFLVSLDILTFALRMGRADARASGQIGRGEGRREASLYDGSDSVPLESLTLWIDSFFSSWQSIGKCPKYYSTKSLYGYLQ